MTRNSIAALTIAISVIGACATTKSDTSVTWSDSLTVKDGIRTPYSLPCTDIASHPCALITFAHAADVGSDSITWHDFTGSDANGNPNSRWDDNGGYALTGVTHGSDGSLVISDNGDDIGFRMLATLVHANGAWSGSITWQLEAEAGSGTMTVRIGDGS